MFYVVYLPAIDAVMKQASVAAMSARKTSFARIDFLLGSIADNAPMMTPIEPILAKPHNAYVAIISERI